MKNQKNILSVALCLFVALDLSVRADVLVSGSVFTNFNYDGDINATIIVGNSSGGASLNVDGGSTFSTVPDGSSGLIGFGINIGVEVYSSGFEYGYASGQYSSDNNVSVSGVGSELICGAVGIGSGTNGGPGNSLTVFDGGGVLGNSGLGINFSGTSNSVLVTGAGSYLTGSTSDDNVEITIAGYGNNFEVLDGAYVANGELECYGSNCSLVIGGTNTTWTGEEDIDLFGPNNSLAITNGASVSAYNIASGQGTENNRFLIDGAGTIVNSDHGIVLDGVGDSFRLSGGANVTMDPAGDYFEMNAPNETATITDPGTIVTLGSAPGYYQTLIIMMGGNETFTISNSAQVTLWGGGIYVGAEGGVEASSGDVLTVTGPGSRLLEPSGSFLVGGGGGQDNQLIITNGASVETTNLAIASGNSGEIAGALYATNSYAGGQITVAGAMNITGLVEANTVMLPSGGSISFSEGQFITGGIMDTASQSFIIGDGTNEANYVMEGGTHSFRNGLVISSNSVLSGCGTVSGNVTNYGLIVLTNGCDMAFSSPIVNYGTILALNGTAYFQSSMSNYGTLFQNTTNAVALSFSGTDVVIQFNTASNYLFSVQAINNLASDEWVTLTNGLLGTGNPASITDFGAATNAQRFYRVVLDY